MRSLIVIGILVVPTTALAADWLQCQTELTKPDCTAVTVNHVPLHFTASCQQCSGQGSDIKCAPGEVASAATMAVEDATTAQPVAGTITQVGSCAFQVPLWSFSGALTKAKTYNVVINVTGHPKTLLFSFTAGQSSGPPADLGVPPVGDGSPHDQGVSTNFDGAPADVGDVNGHDGEGGGTDDGCSCHLTSRASVSSIPLLVLLLVGWVWARGPSRRR